MDDRDFERLGRDIQRSLEQFPLRKVLRLVGLLLVVAIVVLGVLSSFVAVDTDEVGVLQRFGRHVAPPLEPGLHFKLPFLIDRVDRVKVDRVQTLPFGFRSAGGIGRSSGKSREVPEESLMLTGDQNVVDVEWIVQYKIKDAPNWLFNIKNPVDTIRDVSEAAMRLVVGDSSATEVLTARRREIAREVKRAMQKTLDDYGSGVYVQAVELQNVVPPTEAVQDSYNEVNRARQEKDTTINKARREYEKAIPAAEGEKQKTIQEAEGYKLKRINEARGDVAKFVKILGEYEKSPEVTRRRLYLEAIEQLLPKLPRVFVLDEQTAGPLQVLDLEAVGSKAVRGGTAGATTGGDR